MATRVGDFIKRIAQIIKQRYLDIKNLIFTKCRELKKKMRHKCHLYCWIFRIKVFRRGKGSLSRHFGSLRRVTLILLTVAIGYMVLRFSGASHTSSILSNYLVTAGSMIGGTIAIVFTISIFLLQNAANLYSSQYLDVYVHDWKEKFTYFILILISIMLLGMGLYVGSLSDITEVIASNIIISSLLLISTVFVLIDWQYKNVREKINPSIAIQFLEKKGKKFLEQLEADANKLSVIYQTGNEGLSEHMALAAAYNTALIPFINNFDRQLENIVQIATRLADKQEIQTTRGAFTSFYRLISGFLELRKSSSIILPVPTAILAIKSDSRSFLVRNYERLNKAGEKFIGEGKEEYASYLIQVYRGLAAKAADVDFVGRPDENPILECLESYLGLFIEYAERAKNIELSYQGTIALGEIANLAIQKGYNTIIYGVQKRIFERATFALSSTDERNTVIVGQCIDNFFNIISASFLNDKLYRRHVFDDSLKSISKIAVYLSTLIASGYIKNDISTRLLLGKSFDHEFHSVVGNIINGYNDIEEEKEKQSYRSSIVALFDGISSSLRNISEKVKQCDGTLADSIGRLLTFLNDTIIRVQSWDDFEQEKEDLMECLYRNIHLPGLFVYHAESFDGSSNPFRSLNESVAKAGILAADYLNNRELAKKCALALCNIATATLKKSTKRHGYDSPRVLIKACYIAILAQKNGWHDIVDEIVLKIYDFEYMYFEKYFTNLPPTIDPHNHRVIGLPSPDQLLSELVGWSSDFVSERYNRPPFHEDAKSLMYTRVNRIDIDRFTLRVWRAFSTPSPLEEVLEKESYQKRLIKILKNMKMNL